MVNTGVASLLYSNQDLESKLSDHLNSGGDPNTTDLNGNSFLHYLGTNTSGDWSPDALVRLLIEKGAQVNLQNLQGYSPLHLHRDPETIRLLFQAGADPNLQASDGRTVLMMSAGDPKRLEILLEYGKETINLNLQDKSGDTLLHHLLRATQYYYYQEREDVRILQKLLTYNPDVSLANKQGETVRSRISK